MPSSCCRNRIGNRSGVRVLRAADQLARHRFSWDAILEGHLATQDGELVALGALDETAPARRKLKHHLRRMQLERVEVDDVHFGLHPRGEDAAIAKPIKLRGVAGL